jgi:exonuclease VII large subunit
LKTLRDRRPDLLLDQARQDLDYRTDDLKSALQNLLKDKQINLQRMGDFLSQVNPLQMVRPYAEKLKGLEAQLQAYHPHGPLKRGYAIVSEKKSGKILRTTKDLSKGDRLLIQLQKGRLESEVVSTEDENA